MIPQTYKDQVARKYGYKDWEDVMKNASCPGEIYGLYEEAALLYAQDRWENAVDNQRIILSRLFDEAGGTLSSYYTMKELKRPEFKP